MFLYKIFELFFHNLHVFLKEKIHQILKKVLKFILKSSNTWFKQVVKNI
jgi:hypothetical protein